MKKILVLCLAAVFGSALYARADARALYDEQCAKCHGEDGKGQKAMGKKLGAKDYTDPKVQEALTDGAAFKAIKDGLKDKDGKVLMKPMENVSDDDIRGLVSYMRTFKK